MHLLVVEDDKKLAASLKRGLEEEGHAADIALDGEDGLWLATENSYDAIILDIMLPKLSGYEVCSRLREDKIWTPILMLTARSGVEDEARSLDTGADDYLAKPFSFLVLLARLRALVRRGNEPRPTALESGSLRLDPAARRCWIGGGEVTLTSREFSVLEYLVRRASQVVSKIQILDNVWDIEFDGDPNIVEVYIRHLRRKLQLPRSGIAIVTVRGAGYRLDAETS